MVFNFVLPTLALVIKRLLSAYPASTKAMQIQKMYKQACHCTINHIQWLLCIFVLVLCNYLYKRPHNFSSSLGHPKLWDGTGWTVRYAGALVIDDLWVALSELWSCGLKRMLTKFDRGFTFEMETEFIHFSSTSRFYISDLFPPPCR